MSTRMPRRRDALAGLRFEANAFLGFFERQRNLYKRYWIWEVVWLVYSIVSTLSIGYLASGLGSFSGANAHVDIAQRAAVPARSARCSGAICR